MKKSCVCLFLITCLLATLVGCGCSHAFDEAWSVDETYHWHTCTKEGCGEKSDLTEHDFDEGVQTVAPSANADGAIRYTCKVCGKTKNVALPAEPTVDEVEWERAFLMTQENYWMTVVNASGNLIIKKRNNVVVAFDPQSVNESKSYYTIEDGKCYRYDAEGESAVKNEITQQAYLQETTLVDLLVLAYASFTYNEQSKTYEVSQLAMGDTTYENVCVAFRSGQITRVTFTKKVQGQSIDVYNINVTYGTVPEEIELPQVTG